MQIFLNIIVFLVAFAPLPTDAFMLNPSSKYEHRTYKKKWGVTPVHELITLKALRGVDRKLLEGKDRDALLRDLVKGVRWNDDPLNMMTKKRPDDFYVYLKDSCRKSTKINAMWDLLYRTHCGDVQFLHSMASNEEETAEETLAKIMMWFEFTYKVSIAHIEPNRYLRSIDQRLEKGSDTLFRTIMTNNGTTRMLWRPADLFLLECDRDFWKLKCKEFHNNYSTESIRNIALGSMLHVIQDSFSDSHTSRRPKHDSFTSKIHGRDKIELFYSYSKQDHGSHGKADALPVDFKEKTSGSGLHLEDVCAKVISYSLQDRINKTNSWRDVQSYLKDQVFVLADSNVLPAGGKYRKH